MIDALIQLGLSRIEALTFKTLLEVGPCFVAPLVRITGKHRQIIYNALDSLEKKQLIAVSQKNGKNFYTVGDAKALLIELKQKEVLAQEIAEKVEQKLKTEHEQVDVFHGLDSYRRGLADFRLRAADAKEYIVIGGEPREWYEFTRPFFKQHVDEVKKLKRLGIDVFILFYESERRSAEEFIAPHIGNPYVCKIADDKYRLPQTSWLTGDYVYTLTPTSDPLVVRIKSRPLANQYRDYFWNTWKRAVMLK